MGDPLLGVRDSAAGSREGDGAVEGPRVLVVEDDLDLRLYLNAVLRDTYSLTLTADGSEGLASARVTLPDLILTDLGMPIMTGEELLAEVRADPTLERIPVLILTGDGDHATRARLLGHGASDYLLKPFHSEELRARMIKMLEHAHLVEALTAQALAESQLRSEAQAAERRWQLLFEQIPDPTLVVDAAGTVVQANQRVETLLGYAPGDLVGQPVEMLLPEAMRSHHVQLRNGYLQTPRTRSMGAGLELSARTLAGELLPVEVSLAPLVQDGRTMVVATLRDVSSRRRMLAALQASEERFSATFEGAPSGIALLDLRPGAEGTYLDVNDAFAELVGVPRSELVGLRSSELVHPADLAGDERAESLSPGIHRVGERRFRHRDGHYVWTRFSQSVVELEDGERFAITHVQDITLEKEAVDRLAHAALHDGLTGLANRAVLMDRLEVRLAELARRPGLLTVLYIDLDRFKVVNDTLGHAAGDEVLVEFARRLANEVRPGDTASRVGGDEFVVLGANLESHDDVLAFTHRLAAALDHPFLVDGQPCDVSASIGVATVTDATSSAADILRAADAAMYRAKDRGRHRIEIFDEHLAAAARTRFELERELSVALSRDQFRLEYQPVVNVTTGQITSVEALVRFDHPVHGPMLAEEFVSVLEQSGLIMAVDDWVVHRACEQLARWEVALATPPQVSVNLSGARLAKGGVDKLYLGALEAAGANPANLCVELTETVLVDASEEAIQALERLRAAGVQIALDDFGTGYSSLTHLQRSGVDMLKIDRSFTGGLGHLREDAIVEAVTALGRRLDMEIVVEGVERADQRDLVQSLGCNLVQGHLYSRSLRPEVLDPLLVSGLA